MTTRLSTGLRNAIAGSTGFAGALTAGIIEIYSGPQPLSADNATSGTLLARITVDAGAFTPGSPTNGLTFEAAANGAVVKATDETWKGNGLANGTAGWFRFKGNATDAGGSSTTAVRLDGSCGTGGSGDLSLGTLNVETGVPITVDVFSFTVPASA